MLSGKVPLEFIVMLQNGSQTHSQAPSGAAKLQSCRCRWHSVCLNESWLNISAVMCVSHVLFQMYFLSIDPLIELMVLLLLSVANSWFFMRIQAHQHCEQTFSNSSDRISYLELSIASSKTCLFFPPSVTKSNCETASNNLFPRMG